MKSIPIIRCACRQSIFLNSLIVLLHMVMAQPEPWVIDNFPGKTVKVNIKIKCEIDTTSFCVKWKCGVCEIRNGGQRSTFHIS